MSGHILELKKIRKAYGDLVAVDEVSLGLAKGEFLSFLGPSGSGKTTTLQMVAGLNAPTSGEIMLESRPINPLPSYKRNIGIVFQNYALFPHMTVAKNVAFPLEMRGVSSSEIRRRVSDVLQLVGLPELAGRYPRQLSGGQQQRVALARAIVFEPPLLLMDEPLGALDKKLREQMQLEILRLHKRLGMSIIYVTHDQEEALLMSDRIAVFNKGRLEQVGTPTQLYERPATRFVADFVGETNIFPGTVVESADGYCLVNGGALKLRASASLAMRAGQAAIVSIRPERIRLLHPNEAGPERENNMPGRVGDLIYLGRSRKYVIHIGGGLEVVTFQQVEGGGPPSFGPGAEVVLRWTAEDATALPDEAS